MCCLRRWTVLGLVLLGACSGPSTPPASGPKPGSGPAGKVVAKAAAAPAEKSWPRFCGPLNDNRSTETGLLKSWPAAGPKLVWRAQGLGQGFATVAIAGGRIVTAGNRDEQTVVTALGMDGKSLWTAANGKAWTGSYPGTRGTPTIDGARVYHESPLGDVVCLDAKTGDKIWGKNLLKEFAGENITWALAESLLIDGEHLIACPGGKRASVVALDKDTGKTVWTAPGTEDKAGYASPVLAECQGLRMVLTMNQRALIAINADDGEPLFRHEHLTQYDVNATSPIYHDGHVFITSGYGAGSELLKITVDGKKASAERVWEVKDLDNHHGGVLLHDGYLYGANFRSNWVCLDWKSGKKMYVAEGVGKGSLTCADGMLYTFSERRDMGLVPAIPDRHQVVSRFKLPPGGEGESWAYPVVFDKRLYLRHADQLSAYDIQAAQ